MLWFALLLHYSVLSDSAKTKSLEVDRIFRSDRILNPLHGKLDVFGNLYHLSICNLLNRYSRPIAVVNAVVSPLKYPLVVVLEVLQHIAASLGLLGWLGGPVDCSGSTGASLASIAVLQPRGDSILTYDLVPWAKEVIE